MKAPICPYCGHKLSYLRPRFYADKAIKQVLRQAKKETDIGSLSETYAKVTGASYRSGRKAIERLAAQGILTRVSAGIYIYK